MENRMERPEFIEEYGITFRLIGEHYIPCLDNDDEPQHVMQKWSVARMVYLKEHKPVLFYRLIISNSWYRYFKLLDEEAETLYNNLTRDMVYAFGLNDIQRDMKEEEKQKMLEKIAMIAEAYVIQELVHS